MTSEETLAQFDRSVAVIAGRLEEFRSALESAQAMLRRTYDGILIDDDVEGLRASIAAEVENIRNVLREKSA